MNEYPDSKPMFRWECYQMPRPCPFVSCRNHFLEVIHEFRHGKTDDEIVEMLETMPETCVLDYIEREGEQNTEVLGNFFHCSRQRIDQLYGMKVCQTKVKTALNNLYRGVGL